MLKQKSLESKDEAIVFLLCHFSAVVNLVLACGLVGPGLQYLSKSSQRSDLMGPQGISTIHLSTYPPPSSRGDCCGVRVKGNAGYILGAGTLLVLIASLCRAPLTLERETGLMQLCDICCV